MDTFTDPNKIMMLKKKVAELKIKDIFRKGYELGVDIQIPYIYLEEKRKEYDIKLLDIINEYLN